MAKSDWKRIPHTKIRRLYCRMRDSCPDKRISRVKRGKKRGMYHIFCDEKVQKCSQQTIYPKIIQIPREELTEDPSR